MMKILLSISVLLFTTITLGQSFEIVDENDNVVTGDTVFIDGDNSDFNVIEGHLGVHNISTSTKDVKVKRYEVTVVDSSQNYFCWYVCYAAEWANVNPVWPTPSDGAYSHFRTVEADSTDHNLAVYHRPEGTVGTNLYLYVAFDANNESDSSIVYVQIDVGYTSINENITITTNHYPNPATNFLNIQMDKYYPGLNVEVYDMLGKKVESYPVNSSNVVLSIDGLRNGVYFYSIVGENGILTTRKFVVRK